MRSSRTVDGSSVSWSQLTVFGLLPLNSAAFLSVFLTLPQSQSEFMLQERPFILIMAGVENLLFTSVLFAV